MKRASPILHDVVQHTRRNKRTRIVIPVHKYERGSGEAPEIEPTPQIFSRKPTNNPTDKEFKYSLKYADNEVSTGSVLATEYRTALPIAINHAERQVKSITLTFRGGEI